MDYFTITVVNASYSIKTNTCEVAVCLYAVCVPPQQCVREQLLYHVV